MIDTSATRILVSDHTKFDQHEPHFVANLDEFDELFTDRPIDVAGPRPVVSVVAETA